MIKIEDIIVWILFILALIISLWYTFGNSPTFEQAILSVAIAFLFTIALKIGSYGARLNYMDKKLVKLEDSFIRLANDFKSHMNKYHE